MKHFAIVGLCAVSFLFGTLIPLRRTHAQTETPKRTFYAIDYMKSKPGQNVFKMESELWKPIHAQRVKDGSIVSWAVMAPVFGGSHDWDYVTVTGYHSLGGVENEEDTFVKLFKKVMPDKSLDTIMKQTQDARDMLHSELLVTVDEVH